MASNRFSQNLAPPWQRLCLSFLIAAAVGLADGAPTGAEPAGTPDAPAPSIAEAQSVLETAKLRAAKDLEDASLMRAVAIAHLRLGEAFETDGNLEEALTQFQDGLGIAEDLARRDRRASTPQLILARFHEKIGDVQKTQGNTADALLSYRKRIAILGRLARQDPARLDSQRNLAASYNSLGDAYAAQEDHAQALQNYQQGLVIANQVSAADPGDPLTKAALDESLEKVRQSIRKLGDAKPTAPASDIIPGGGDGRVSAPSPIPSMPPPATAAPSTDAGGRLTAPAPLPSMPPPATAGVPPPAPVPAATVPMFPWPPPRASASYVLPGLMLAHYPTVGAVTDALLSALETNGYVERSFYRTPHGGVALVTRLERINDDGSPVADATRWPASSRRDDSTASLYRFLMGLFYVDPGRYRVIVFVLQNLPFAQSPQNVTSEDARAWLGGGANVLPPSLAALPFKGAHCTALIYEFASDGTGVRPVASRLTGKGHLQQAGLLPALGDAP